MGVELGIGETLIVKAIAQSTGRSAQQIKQDLVKVGDLGLVAEVSRFALNRRPVLEPCNAIRSAIKRKAEDPVQGGSVDGTIRFQMFDGYRQSLGECCE